MCNLITRKQKASQKQKDQTNIYISPTSMHIPQQDNMIKSSAETELEAMAETASNNF